MKVRLSSLEVVLLASVPSHILSGDYENITIKTFGLSISSCSSVLGIVLFCWHFGWALHCVSVWEAALQNKVQIPTLRKKVKPVCVLWFNKPNNIFRRCGQLIFANLSPNNTCWHRSSWVRQIFCKLEQQFPKKFGTNFPIRLTHFLLVCKSFESSLKANSVNCFHT